MSNPTVGAHAGIVPELASAFADPNGNAVATSAANPLPINPTTAGASAAAIASAATVAAGSISTIKASAGVITSIELENSAASLRSFKLFNAGTITLGTTPAAFEIDIPAGAQVSIAPPSGIAFNTAIKWIVTAAKGLTDVTATGLAANDVTGVVTYN